MLHGSKRTEVNMSLSKVEDHQQLSSERKCGILTISTIIKTLEADVYCTV